MGPRGFEAILIPAAGPRCGEDWRDSGRWRIVEKEIPLKTSLEVSRIRRTCRLIETLFLELKRTIRPGMTTVEVSRFCDTLLRAGGGQSALKGYRGFPESICTSVNNVAAHGIPGNYVLRSSDIISVDITAHIDGWYGDSAWTYLLGEGTPDTRRLLKAAWQATMAGINAARAGGRLGDIGAAVQDAARKLGCSVLDKFVGHGIGIEMHEEPMVLNFGTAGTGQPIVPGMVFTVEPILCLGSPNAHLLKDGWSIVTSDSSLCAQYEHTVAVFRDRTEILTLATVKNGQETEYPPFY